MGTFYYNKSSTNMERHFKNNNIAKMHNTIDALLGSLLDPLEGLGVLNCGKLELGAAPDFQH